MKNIPLISLKILIGTSLCVYFFFLLLPEAMPRRRDNNGMNAYLFTKFSHAQLRANLHEDYDAEFPVFTARAASQFLTGELYDIPRDPQFWNGYRFSALSISFGLYHSLWLALLFGLLIYYRRDSVFVMLGTFAGLMYNLTIPAGCWWYPWDMPSMCLFTWAILVFLKNEYYPLLLIVFVASLFKETGLVGALLVLFGPWSRPKRLAGFAGLVLAFYLTRRFLMYAGGSEAILLPFNNAGDVTSFVHRALSQCQANLGELFAGHLNSPVFANCGLIFVMFLLPGRVAVKLTAAGFLAGQLFFGLLMEFRDLFELLPLGMMQLSDYLKSKDGL